MNRSTLTEVLQDAGLSPYQAEAYVTVLQFGSASATDIAEKCGVPDPRIYDVLRDLEDRGYVETYEQDSLHARAYSPDTVLSELRDRASEFEAAADEIEERWEAPEMDSHTVSFVKQMRTVLDKAETKIRNSENQIQIAVGRDQYEWLRPALKTAHENGVHVSLVLQTEDSTDSLPPESELQSVATEVRHRTVPVPFIALVDRSVTCFAPHNLSANRYGIIVEDRTLAYVCHWFFLAGLWEATTPVYADTDDSLPRTYVNIRRCIRDIRAPLENGATVSATIEGIDVDSGSETTLEGTILDISYPGLEQSGEALPFLYLGGQATIVFDTGDEVVEVGGWGAVIEDYEAIHVVVTEVTE